VSVSRLDRPGASPDSTGSGPLVPLRSRTGAALITATVLASATTAVDANVIKVAVPAIGKSLGAPLLRLSLFTSRQFDAINVMTLVFYGALGAASYLVILQCELRLGYSPADAGAALIPESVVFLLLAPVSGALVARVGPRWLMTGGIVLVAAGFGWLSAAQPGQGYAAAILPGVLLWGLGIGLAVTPLTAAVLAAVGDADLGEAVITALFVTDDRAGHRGRRLVPRAPEAGCPPPVPALATQEES
jgi:Na+/melibiose symporter-like transporter